MDMGNLFYGRCPEEWMAVTQALLFVCVIDFTVTSGHNLLIYMTSTANSKPMTFHFTEILIQQLSEAEQRHRSDLRSVVIQIWRLPTNVFRMLRSVIVQIYEMLRSVIIQIWRLPTNVFRMLRSIVIQIWRLLTNVFEMLKSMQTNGWRNGSVRWASMVLTAC
jgi:phage-related protein